MSEPIRVAILDLNNNHPNQGLRCIKELVDTYPDQPLEWEVFDVRHGFEVPDTSFDIYIGSGGPGNPLEEGTGERLFLELLDQLWYHNQTEKEAKKHFLFICHSFQLACRYFDLALIKERRSKAFGIFPVHKIAGESDPILDELPDPFYALDFRDFQIIEADSSKFEELGAKILLREKERPHIDLERAIMGIRFSDQWVGFQFHPEADPEGVSAYFKTDEKKRTVIGQYGQDKYDAILDGLTDADKIPLTYQTVIPVFIRNSIEQIRTHQNV